MSETYQLPSFFGLTTCPFPEPHPIAVVEGGCLKVEDLCSFASICKIKLKLEERSGDR